MIILQMLFDLFKIFVLMSILKNPMLVPAIACVIVWLMALGGIFIKFKNGIFSWVLYFILLLAPIGYLGATWYVMNNPPEDLQLRRPRSVKVDSFSSEGVVYRARFSTRSEPLLGVSIPSDKAISLADAYLKTIAYERLYARESGIYSGVILETSSGVNINEYFLDNGIASVAETHPKSYEVRQGVARSKGVGIWSVSQSYSVPEVPNRILILILVIYTICGVGLVIVKVKNGTNNCNKD